MTACSFTRTSSRPRTSPATRTRSASTSTSSGTRCASTSTRRESPRTWRPRTRAAWPARPRSSSTAAATRAPTTRRRSRRRCAPRAAASSRSAPYGVSRRRPRPSRCREYAPRGMTGPSYTRLDVDERRRQLLETGARVFTERAYEDVSMADVAREAGISKGLLYHYFPSKRDFFSATLEAAASELRALTDTDPSLPPLDQLRASLDSYLAWIEANAPSYRKLIESAASTDEARSMVDRVRHDTVERMLEGLVA